MERIRVATFKTCSFPPDCLALHPASLASFCVFLVRGREKQALPGSCQAVEELFGLLDLVFSQQTVKLVFCEYEHLFHY